MNATYEGVVHAPMSLAMISTLSSCHRREGRETRGFFGGVPSVIVRGKKEGGKSKKTSHRRSPSPQKKSRLRFLETGSWGPRAPNATSTFEFPKASRLFHRSSRRGADFFSAIARSSRRRKRRGGGGDAEVPAPSAGELQVQSRETVSGGFRARGASSASIEARSRRDLVAAEWRLFSRVAICVNSPASRGYVPVVLPDADAGVRRAEIDPDGGAVNLGHGALTGEVSERRCTSVRSATGKVTAKPSGRGFFSTRKRQFQ